ncbi:unnamed protein product [Discosporangium mesarthrocarpum]
MNERLIFMREYSRGAYRAVSYSVANMLIYIPVFLILSVVFLIVSYFMVGLPSNGFGFYVFVVFMVLVQGSAFATFISGIAPDPLTGNGMGTALMAFMFLFSGFFIPYDDIPAGWRWFSYLSMFKYPFEGLIKNMIDETVAEGDITQEAGDDFAKFAGVDIPDMWRAIWAPLIFTFVFRFLFTVVLITKHSGSRK